MLWWRTLAGDNWTTTLDFLWTIGLLLKNWHSFWLNELRLLNVELLRRVLGVVQQQLTGFKVRPVDVGEAVHHIDGSLRAHRVHEAEGAAEEGRKAQAENGANVALKLR